METTNKQPEETSNFLSVIIKQNLPNTRKEWIIFILLILVVITLGLVAVNSYLGIQYKAQLITNPCALCEEFQVNILNDPNNINLITITDLNITSSPD